MKLIHKWSLAPLQKSPLFSPLSHALERLNTVGFPTRQDWNRLVSQYYSDIRVQSGPGLSFVAQEEGKQGFESQYEPRCYLNGEVQTRENNWHDLFNALVWLTFPKAKAAINARHYHALKTVQQDGVSQRGQVRDMATLLDESGVIVVSANSEATELLRTFQWKELFWHQREQVQTSMGFYIFGHGLYEKGLEPYIGMTGQAFILNVPADFFKRTEAEQLGYLDERVADYLNNSDNCQTPRELNPVPLLGIPGWSIENNNAAYYDNTAYFRSGRHKPV